LSDDAYGFIDLAPYYYDGSSASNPSAGLPREIGPIRGWMNGVRAEFYDFGLVGVTKKRTNSQLPDYAAIAPMYFFYDSAGNPLVSKPIFEGRTGQWHMRGGKNVLNPNPTARAPKNVPYSVRVRDYLVDRTRGVPDYQRPIVDILQHTASYSGLWEIWEVKANGDYEPDSIKSYKTLKAGIDDGTFEARRTQRVINCPVIDDRTYVVPTAMQYGIPRPRIEIWYRTKQGSCYLADGWFALGDGAGNLHKFNQDSRRLNMFDVIAYTIGSGAGARTTLTAPVSRMFIPTVKVATLDTRGTSDVRYTGDNVVEQATPKLSPADPPGYRPVRWMWDLIVPQDPPYRAASYKSVTQMDPANMAARSGPFTKNFPLIGAYTSCNSNEDCANVGRAPGIELECYGLRVSNGSTAFIDEPGGAHCNVPRVRFGQFCAPGIAICGSFDPKRDPAMGPPLTPDEEAAKAINDTADDAGLKPALIGGYTCQPNTSAGGYCFIRCNSSAPAGSKAAGKVDIKYKGPDGQEKTEKGVQMPHDARCGFLPGYRCLNPAGSGIPTDARVCLRQCDTGRPDTFNDQFCRTPLDVSLNEVVTGRDIQKGMSCSNRGINGAAGCQWDPAYEPRDPNANFVP
jgi:hypothetical protein